MRNGGHSYRVDVRRVGVARYHVTLDGHSVSVDAERHGPVRSRLDVGGVSHPVVSSVQDTDHLVEVDGVAHRFSRDDAGVVRAPAAALVVSVAVEAGAVVDAGDRLAVVEAMKMEIPITAPVGGRVRDVFVSRNTQVDAGAPLVRIETSGDGDGSVTSAPRIDISTLAAGELGDPCRSGSAMLRSFVLGFDVDRRHRAARRLDALPGTCGDEYELLATFADLVAIAPERRQFDGPGEGVDPRAE